MTSVFDEPFFRDIFLDYYSNFFKASDIYIIDHVYEGASYNQDIKSRCNLIPWSHDVLFDENPRYEFINKVHRHLLSKYETVLACDIDEILFPNPDIYADLGEYLRLNDSQPFIRAKGYEILHIHDEEPALDYSKQPYLQQRKWWFFNKAFNKVVLHRIPITYYPGFHETNITMEYFNENKRMYPADRNLKLIHLRRIDYKVCFERALRMAEFKMVATAYGLENMLRNFNGYYYDLIYDAKRSKRGVVSFKKKNMKELKEPINANCKNIV